MPISATGAELRFRRADPAAGFSLMEMLATLFVLALAAAAVVVVIPQGQGEARRLAERMAQRMAQAAEESVMVNRAVAMTATPEGYGFARLEDTGWTAIRSAPGLGFEIWPEGLEVRPEGAPPASLSGRDKARTLATFDPTGGASPVRLIVREEGSPAWIVSLDPQGRARIDRAS